MVAELFKSPRANRRLPAAAQPLAGPNRVVFPGGSINVAWRLAEFFPCKPSVNRGISGQTASQMRVRILPDVISPNPATPVVLAGANDIGCKTGPQTLEMIGQNFQAFTEPAQLRGIKAALRSLLPVSGCAARKQTERRPPEPSSSTFG